MMSNVTPIEAVSLIRKDNRLWINGIVSQEVERQRRAGKKREADLNSEIARFRIDRDRQRKARVELLLEQVNSKPSFFERLQELWEKAAAMVICWMERHGLVEYVPEWRDE